MASRDINDLLPPVRQRAIALDQRLDVLFNGSPISTAIVCTWRDPREQLCLYMQGRSPLDLVNKHRAKIGLPKITAAENKIRTRAQPGSSMHEYRCAFDLLAFENGKVIGDGDHPVYKQIGEIGEQLGLEWAGRWKGKLREAAHFQYLGGLTIAELRQGKVPV